MFAGHVSRTLDALADPSGYSVGLSHFAILVTYWAAVLCLLARLVLPGRSSNLKGLGRSGQARRGCVPWCLSSTTMEKAILRNEQVAPRVGGVDVIAWC